MKAKAYLVRRAKTSHVRHNYFEGGDEKWAHDSLKFRGRETDARDKLAEWKKNHGHCAVGAKVPRTFSHFTTDN